MMQVRQPSGRGTGAARFTKHLALVFTTLVLTAGCGSDGKTPRPTDLQQGTLRLEWTIRGDDDPSACAGFGNVIFVATLFRGDFLYGSVNAECRVFATELPLRNGSYAATSRLLDQSGFARTVSIPSGVFAVEENETTTVAIDFADDTIINGTANVMNALDAGTEP